ncbi:DNA polymerase III subunit beta [Streptomyces sp. NPDC093272]|uniref:DNA polymerase III subunit beta n=1 Tax=Streptomyces sp. NPDC093272 TaxID=3154981 RepID=UPI00341E1811
MKLRIDQKLLADAARAAHRRLPNNPINPILAGLLIEATGEQVTISGFDLETSTRAVLHADTLETGEALVSGRLLADVAANLPAGPVDVVADEREVTVTAPGTVFTLPSMTRGDYPALPTPPGAAGSIDGDLFAERVGHAATVAMAPKEAVGSRLHFGGVHVSTDGAVFTVEASDGYRIARHVIGWQPDTAEAGELLIPAADFATTVKQTAGGRVHLGFPGAGGGPASIASDTLTVTSRTIASEYADLDAHFPNPEAAAGSAVFDAEELTAAVKRAALVNDAEGKSIQIGFGDGHATVRGGHGGPTGSSRVDCETDSLDGFSIAYNPHYLASLLAPIGGQVRMWFTTPTKPALIEPVDDPTYRAVCMPVRLK